MSIHKIPILMYHHINHHNGDTVTLTPDVFTAQMRFLHDEGYQVLSINELLEFISGNRSVCARTVVLSFDDGWLDNFVYAVPVLKQLNFKASFFLITGRVDAVSTDFNLEICDTPAHNECKRLIAAGSAGRVVINWNHVRALGGSGLFSFYSHTVSHKKAAELSSEQIHFELTHSKARIEAETGRDCHYLCWPYGSFTPEATQLAAEAGYKAVFTTIDGLCEAGSDPFVIKRIEAQNSVEWLKNRLSVENR